MKKERSSNIELLRIVAMLMIIAYHIWYHAIKIQLSTDVNYFIQPMVYKRLFIFSIISPFGQIANALFIIISGYFLCEKKSINLTNISKKILLQLLFASIVLVVGSTIVYKLYKSAYISLLDINYFNTSSWFIGYYFAIILFAYLFLNKYLNRLDSNSFKLLLVTIFTVTQLYFSIKIVNNISDGLNTVLIGIFLYSLGGYLKKYNPFKNIKSVVFISIIVVTNLLIILSTYNQIIKLVVVLNITIKI